MNYQLRRSFYYENMFDQLFIDILHAATDPDSIFLSTIITRPMHHQTAAVLLKANGTQLALVYANFMCWSSKKRVYQQLDHPLVDFINADAPLDYLKVARKWNEPFLWDQAVLRMRLSCAREAAQAGSPWGMVWHAYVADDLRPAERADLHRRAYAILPSLREPNLDDITNQYRNGRLLHAIGSQKDPADRSYYLEQREHATRATCAWLIIAKRLGLYRDIARLIGTLVYQHCEQTRSTKKLKK